MTTRPNKWVLLRIEMTEGEVIHKVFGSWSGGYLDGDSWQLNSGIEKVEYHDDRFVFQGYSGSTYTCSKDGYGIAGSSNYAVSNDLLNRLNSHHSVSSAEILPEYGAIAWLDEMTWTMR